VVGCCGLASKLQARVAAWSELERCRCRHRRTLSYRHYPSRTFAPPHTTMAAKRGVFVLRPALNGTVPSSLRAQCLSNSSYARRQLSLQTSPPRKLALKAYRTVRYASTESEPENLGKTGLYELHTQHGAKFVPFGGYSMPVQYSDLSIGDSHKWTREKASLFDVGHMYVFFKTLRIARIRLTHSLQGSTPLLRTRRPSFPPDDNSILPLFDP
jgi:hypothetical protein